MLKVNPPAHAVVPTDAPKTACSINMATNKNTLNSLNNIDKTMGQMVGLIDKFYEDRSQETGKDRPIRNQALMSQSRNLNITLAAQML